MRKKDRLKERISNKDIKKYLWEMSDDSDTEIDLVKEPDNGSHNLVAIVEVDGNKGVGEIMDTDEGVIPEAQMLKDYPLPICFQ